MQGSRLSLTQLLIGVVFLEIGNGLQSVLIPIRAQLEGFTTLTIGLLGTAYYLGFVIGCRAIPTAIHRVGHVRVFSGYAALAAAAFLILELNTTVPVWITIRIVLGFCFAALYISLESWLNNFSIRSTRGRIFAVYMVVSWIAVIVGKLIFSFSEPTHFAPFALVSIGFCLAILPVTFVSQCPPNAIASQSITFRYLYNVSPVGLVGCIVLGAINGAFWTLTPIYASSLGFDTFHIGLLISAAVLGGALTQWPIGKLSDRIDRRYVIVLACVASVASAVMLMFNGKAEMSYLVTFMMVYGASALPLYALCVAHANDRAPADSFIEVSGDLLLLFGIGAVMGPYIAAMAINVIGAGGLFLFTLCAHSLLATFTILRLFQTRHEPELRKDNFIPIPGPASSLLTLDPRISAGNK